MASFVATNPFVRALLRATAVLQLEALTTGCTERVTDGLVGELDAQAVAHYDHRRDVHGAALASSPGFIIDLVQEPNGVGRPSFVGNDGGNEDVRIENVPVRSWHASSL